MSLEGKVSQGDGEANGKRVEGGPKMKFLPHRVSDFSASFLRELPDFDKQCIVVPFLRE